MTVLNHIKMENNTSFIVSLLQGLPCSEQMQDVLKRCIKTTDWVRTLEPSRKGGKQDSVEDSIGYILLEKKSQILSSL